MFGCTKIVITASVAAMVLVAVLAPGFKRSIPGRIVRWLQGETGAQQTVNDLAEDIRDIPELGRLQTWSVETLARFRSGQVHTNGLAAYWSVGTARLAAQERPTFVTQRWGATNVWGEESPEISVRLSTNGQPECVVIAWYLHGIVAGPPEYRMSFHPWCYAQAKPGIYAYHLYK